MVAALQRGYRWSVARILSLSAILAALFFTRPTHADSVITSEDVGAVFSESSISPEKLRQSGHFAGSSGYSQAYYQAYYQGSYELTFTDNVTESKDFTVFGSISKGAGTFVIDHPLDPKNKLLYHSFVESPDSKNMYDGVATLDGNGEAIVSLPSYFMALNTDFRYQLKPIGVPQPNLHIKSEIADNRFTITGGVPNGRVSWQITGNRHDAFALAEPIIPEVKKDVTTLVRPGELVHEGTYPARKSYFRIVAETVRSWIRPLLSLF